MTHHITAYCRGSADQGYYDLTDWNGKTILAVSCSRISVVFAYWNEVWGTPYAITYRLPNNRGWIVGYSLGDGCLFRGEYFAPSDRILDYDDSDAERYAKAVAEYWIERDAEDEERFQEELREEEQESLLSEWEQLLD